MKTLLSLFIIVLLASHSLSAQNELPPLSSKARFTVRPMIFVDYSFYHWYQSPLKIGERPQNVGQVFNILPGIGGGLLMGSKTTFLFTLEGAVRYMPFSLDVDGFEGMGAIAFPILAGVRIPIHGILFVNFGGGVQWTKTNLYAKTAAFQQEQNPFFMTYIGELGLGLEENIFLMFFSRFGYAPNQAITFDFGLKIGLNGNLWD